MSKKREFVGTGLHYPMVHLWARVLVQPDRLAGERQRALNTVTIYLVEGDRLEVDARGMDDGYEKPKTVRAFNAVFPDYHGETPFGLIAWNQRDADVTVYGRDVEAIQNLANPLRETLYGVTTVTGRDPTTVSRRPAVSVDANSLVSIQIGDVLVCFDRSDDRKKAGPSPEEVSAQIDEERMFFRSTGLTHPVDAARSALSPDGPAEGGTLGRLKRAKAQVSELASNSAASLCYHSHLLKEDLLHTIEDAIVQVRQDDRIASEMYAAVSGKPAA